eukprot:351876-Chlamydomonas_euryale.AAC.5
MKLSMFGATGWRSDRRAKRQATAAKEGCWRWRTDGARAAVSLGDCSRPRVCSARRRSPGPIFGYRRVLNTHADAFWALIVALEGDASAGGCVKTENGLRVGHNTPEFS